MSKTIPVDASFVSVQLPEDHDPTKPFPLTIKRDFDNPNCWATGDGKKVFRDQEWAAKSMEMDTPEYRERSRLRMEYSRLVKAEVVKWRDWVFADGYGYNEGYFDSRDELMEWCADEGIEAPSYAFSTTTHGFKFHVCDVLEDHLNDNHHEDARDSIVGWDELERFWAEWSAKQTLKTYYPDYSKIVVIDDARFQAELAQAKAWLAENASS